MRLISFQFCARIFSPRIYKVKKNIAGEIASSRPNINSLGDCRYVAEDYGLLSVCPLSVTQPTHDCFTIVFKPNFFISFYTYFLKLHFITNSYTFQIYVFHIVSHFMLVRLFNFLLSFSFYLHTVFFNF